MRPITKEVQFFTVNHGRSERWYRGHFPRLLPTQQTFESSPYYLFHPHAPLRAASRLPLARHIVLLRDPTARAYSHYLHSRALGVEQLSFENALDAEASRLEEAHRLGLDSAAGQRMHRRYSYMSRGKYLSQVQRWIAAVGHSRLLVLKSEDWFADPGRTYADILTFLDLPPFSPYSWTNSNGRSSNREAIAPATRLALRRDFEADSEKLRHLLGWESAWT